MSGATTSSDIAKALSSIPSTDMAKIMSSPLVVGIGGFPRLLSDEDYVAQAERRIQKIGARQFLIDMLETMRGYQP